MIVRVMTALQRDNLIKNKARYTVWIGELDRVIREISVNGTASATISASGGSKSYTRLDLGTLQKLRVDYADRVSQIQKRLDGVPLSGIRRVMITRC